MQLISKKGMSDKMAGLNEREKWKKWRKRKIKVAGPKFSGSNELKAN